MLPRYEETSNIHVSVRHNELGALESENYKWVGKSPYTYVSGQTVFDLVGGSGMVDNIQIGPYKLLLVSRSEAFDTYLYVRADVLGHLRVLFYKTTRMLDFVYRRMILTLAVWGLAEYHPSTLPSYKDIKIVKRFMK